MNDERLDLSPLDPMEDPTRWRSLVEGTLHRVDAVLAERSADEHPLMLIASWRRRLLWAAAAALAILVPAEIALELREAKQERVDRLVTISSHWGPVPPTGATFLRALGVLAP
jgi:hypothetical protein